MKSGDQRGFLAPFVLILLFSVSSQILSLSKLQQRGMIQSARRREAAQAEEQLWDQAARFIQTFLTAGAEHPTPHRLEGLPGYSHRTGAVFYYEPSPGTILTLEELSSRLNPYSDGIGFWEAGPLAARLIEPAALGRWEEERRGRGGVEAPEDLSWLFPREDWDFLYGIYTLPGEEGWNIHFLDPLILEAAARFPWGGKGFIHPRRVYNLLRELPRQGPVTEDDLEAVLAEERPEARRALLSRLGTRSWFWKIRVSCGSGPLELIIRYYPRFYARRFEEDGVKDAAGDRGFRLVSWKKGGRP